MTTAYIGLGSNLHDPLQQLRQAVRSLAALPDTRLERLSAIYRSAAVGPGRQPDYLNAVARLDTVIAAPELLARLHRIEAGQGRERRERWGARTLDLDLLLYGDATSDTAALTLPHPRMAQRDFVLVPLREACGENLLLPDGRELDTLMAQCPRGRLEKTAYQFGESAHG
jgi:2-amino-4-hydroxy-6-hydroxymethyldihydropteridine diphosphokinase